MEKSESSQGWVASLLRSAAQQRDGLLTLQSSLSAAPRRDATRYEKEWPNMRRDATRYEKEWPNMRRDATRYEKEWPNMR
ncbi:MAG: hypothetical protein DRP66_08595, partial [Planctomycetota bacterium]